MTEDRTSNVIDAAGRFASRQPQRLNEEERRATEIADRVNRLLGL